MARDVDRGKSDAAADIVNQHGLLALQRAHDYEQLPRREVVYRNRRGLFVGERGRFREDLFLRHNDHVRIAPKRVSAKTSLPTQDWSTPGPTMSTVPETS